MIDRYRIESFVRATLLQLYLTILRSPHINSMIVTCKIYTQARVYSVNGKRYGSKCVLHFRVSAQAD